MQTIPSPGQPGVLSSDWTGLSPHLIAKFYALTSSQSEDGRRTLWRRDPDSPEVWALLTDGTVDHTANWNSQFENVGVDQQFSAISALIQSGEAAKVLNRLEQALGVDLGLAGAARKLEGRGNMTKLNSRQIYNGSPPVKLTFTAHFRGLVDAAAEVEAPLSQLIAWALPQQLAEDGPVLSAAKGEFSGLFPSRIPRIIGMDYGGLRFSPMVIESIPYPLTGPRHRTGKLLSAQVAMTIASLTALDASDWRQVVAG